MSASLDSKNDFLIIAYSSVFIASTYFLLLKISPILFSFFCFLPLISIALITNLKQTLLSFLVSIFLIVVVLYFQNRIENINNTFFLTNIIFVFGFSFLFLLILGMGKRKDDFGEKLSFYVLTTSIIFISLFIFYLSDSMNDLIIEIKQEYANLVSPDNQIMTKELNKLFEGIIKIFPSINFIFHFFTILTNLFLAKEFLNKFKIPIKKEINQSTFIIPNWYLVIYLVFFGTSLIFNDDLQYFFLNLVISLSCIFFTNGFYIFKKFFLQISQPLFLKIIILFLLFIFLGYVLFLSLFFLGFVNKLKHFFKKRLN